MQLYSVRYISGDAGYARFVAKLGLITALLTVVGMSGDLIVLYVDWELVTLAMAQLLVDQAGMVRSARRSARRAMLTNRIGGASLLLGVIVALEVYGSADLHALGYSTMGQLGFMMMEAGLGPFALAVFHLIGHGAGEPAQLRDPWSRRMMGIAVLLVLPLVLPLGVLAGRRRLLQRSQCGRLHAS